MDTSVGGPRERERERERGVKIQLMTRTAKKTLKVQYLMKPFIASGPEHSKSRLSVRRYGTNHS